MTNLSLRLAAPSVLPALSEMDLTGIQAWVERAGLPRYRAQQIYHRLSRQFAQDFGELTELPAGLRGDLERQFRLRTLHAKVHLTSKLDRSEKVLFTLHDGTTVESVLIPSRGSTGRELLTVCVSSQVGCPAACSFCATGLSGFARNLTVAEIADQVMYFAHAARARGARITNVVFMGMGEPFLNPIAVRGAVDRLVDPAGFGLGDRHITVSTVGIVPQLRKFASWGGQVNLAVSLHAPNDELRSTLVPYNQHFPIRDLMEAVHAYIRQTGRRVSFEYVLLRGVNDGLDLADDLARLTRPFGGMAHVNLIPWNPFRDGQFVRSEGPDADAFARRLEAARVNATVRYSKGLDISAACGQLRERATVADAELG